MPVIIAPPPPQQTRVIDPMLFECWSAVFDVGPTLKQQWVKASCLLGGMVIDSGDQPVSTMTMASA